LTREINIIILRPEHRTPNRGGDPLVAGNHGATIATNRIRGVSTAAIFIRLRFVRESKSA
jgi:hypothetical protein